MGAFDEPDNGIAARSLQSTGGQAGGQASSGSDSDVTDSDRDIASVDGISCSDMD